MRGGGGVARGHQSGFFFLKPEAPPWVPHEPPSSPPMGQIPTRSNEGSAPGKGWAGSGESRAPPEGRMATDSVGQQTRMKPGTRWRRPERSTGSPRPIPFPCTSAAFWPSQHRLAGDQPGRYPPRWIGLGPLSPDTGFPGAEGSPRRRMEAD